MSVLSSKAASTATAVADELIYENDSVRVSLRILVDGSTCIVKQAKSMQAIQRLAHELAILERLAEVDGVTQFARVAAEPNTVVLQDAGSTSLARFLRGSVFTMVQWVELAAALARTLAQVHRRDSKEPLSRQHSDRRYQSQAHAHRLQRRKLAHRAQDRAGVGRCLTVHVARTDWPQWPCAGSALGSLLAGSHVVRSGHALPSVPLRGRAGADARSPGTHSERAAHAQRRSAGHHL